MNEVVTKRIEDWDLGTYPAQIEGRPASDWFKVWYEDANGQIGWKTERQIVLDGRGREVMDEDGRPQEIVAKIAAKVVMIKGGGTDGQLENFETTNNISPEDLRKAEKRIEGKPTRVAIGLWYYPVYVDDRVAEWKEVDRKANVSPLYWRDITEIYYREWRPKAYEKMADPFKHQQRPYTRVQELEMELKAKEKALADNLKELDSKQKELDEKKAN